MNITRSATYAIGVLTAAALIAGCSSGSGSSTSALGLAPGSANSSHVAIPMKHHGHGIADTFIGVKWTGHVHSDTHKSWVSPDAALAPRLYFASNDGTNDVYIYTMPGMQLKGTLTGFSEPQGMCNDTHGNIYIANTSDFNVLEYSRTGTLLNTYPDAYGYPVGCAVDPATGNLAVFDIFGLSGAGQVLVFSSPSGSPTVLTNPSGYFYYFGGYGPGSDLWVAGRDPSGTYQLSVCGSSSCSTLALTGGTIYFPGAVQWDGSRSEWVVFDQLCNDTTEACSYPVSGTTLGTPTVYSNYSGGNVCDLIQGTIAAHGMKYVAGGDYEYCGAASSSYNRWGYTGGGTPTNYTTPDSAYALPVGAAISTK
jgi:hypothetical protein